MSPIELTDEQRKLVEAEHGQPVNVIDPATNRKYVLLACELFEKVRSALPPTSIPPEQMESAADFILPGILRSQQAFWRCLPDLLKTKSNHGKWVCYHDNERIGIAPTERDLIRECVRRGLRDDEYHTDVIEPRAQAPWEIEVVETRQWAHEEGDETAGGDRFATCRPEPS